MADSEIQELKTLKRTLITKLSKLRDDLRKQEKRPRRGRGIALNDRFPKFFNDPYEKIDDSPASKKYITRLCDVSQSVLGVQFKNAERNWIHDNIYRYDAYVVTKAFQFALELTVDIKAHENFQIEDINCHFINLDNCFLEEIAPWTLRFTREKNFTHLMSAVSEYSEISLARAKILRTLEAKRYVSMEKCNEEGGGVLAYVHPPSADDNILFKFQWYTKFIDRTWHVEHIFSIETIQADENFIEANKDLLQGFCKIGLGKTELEKLWSDLCTAIDALNEQMSSIM